MLYRLVKILMTTGLRFFYRHIYSTGFENIPKTGPVIMIANHPSSLMDAALLGVLASRPVYFFTRGDVFINKPVKRILSWLHMLPVYPHQTSRSTVGINEDSFSKARNILAAGGVIVFFPESTSHPERELYPLRKGIFRLAFQTAASNNFRFELPIVPVGISYNHPAAARSTVQVHAGKPLLISSLKALYQANPSACLLRIAKEAWEAIAENALHLLHKDRFSTAELLLENVRNNNEAGLFPWRIDSRQELEKEKSLCNYINRLNNDDFAAIRNKANDYAHLLNKSGLEDKTLSPGFGFAGRKTILLCAGFPFYVTGMLLNALPVLIARGIADKRVYRADFYSWIFVSCYTLLYAIWLIAVLGTSMIFGWQCPLIVFIFMLITGIFSYYYIDWKKERRQFLALNRLSAQQLTELKRLRSDLTIT
jgi:1-acyl-sn-glycerol-3-phosphate acyltransferase